MEIYQSKFFSDANLKAYYRLDDVNDDKNSYNLTNVSSCTFSTCKYGNGMVQTGANYLWTTSTLTINAGDMSMCGWIKLNAENTGSRWTLMTHARVGDMPDNAYIFIKYEYSGGINHLGIEESNATPVYADVTLGTSRWNHICAVRSGSTAYLYLNGESIGSGAVGTRGVASGQEGFAIGNEIGANPSNARFDDVAVFNDALTATEVRTIYTEYAPMFVFL